MKPIFSSLLLSLVLIGSLFTVTSCDNISPDIQDKIKSEAQDLQDKLKQGIETGIQETNIQSPLLIATMEGIQASSLCARWQYCLYVELKPTPTAVANIIYTVSLYEKSSLRDNTTIQWNQPELNVLKEKLVNFPISKTEYDAYFGENISHIFSVKVHE
jgi:hypothetical protein